MQPVRRGWLAWVSLAASLVGCSSSSVYDRCTSDPQANPCVLNKAACCGCYDNPPCEFAGYEGGSASPGVDATTGQGGGADATLTDTGGPDAKTSDATTSDAMASDATDGTTSQPDAPADAPSMPDSCTLHTHSDGVGQTWQDCAPSGTYDQAEAAAACAAYTAAIPNATCESPAGCAQVCAMVASSVEYCWIYQGTNAGRVANSSCGTPVGTWD